MKDAVVGQAGIDAARETIVSSAVRLMCVAGLAWYVALVVIERTFFHTFYAYFYLALMTGLCIISLMPRVGASLRLWAVISFAYAVTVLCLGYIGIAPGGGVTTIAVVLIATLYWGARGGMIAVALFAATFAGFAYAWSAGIFPPGDSLLSVDFRDWKTWLRTGAVVLAGATGIVAVVCIFVNALKTSIVKLSAALEDLRGSELRYRTLFEEAGDYALVLQPRPNDVPVIVDANEAALKAHGYSREELIGRPITVIDPDSPETMIERDRHVRSSAAPLLTVQHRRKDGSLFDAEARIRSIRLGKDDLVVSVERDVTERKRMEERLRQVQKMESIGHLAGGVAHEFNNILSAMMLNLEVLKAQLEQPSSKELLEEIESLSRRAAGVVGQLLAFGRKSVISRRSVDLNTVVGDFSRLYRGIAGEGIDLTFSCQDLVSPAHADPGMIERILLNLCMNACEAMPEGGRIVVRLEETIVDAKHVERVDGAKEGRFVCLSVADTGCGMSESTMRRAFEPFFTTKDVGKGTGLGLSTVDGLVHQHGGWIEVESEVGKGSVFRVYLPALVAPAAVASETIPAAATSRGNETILLVEDEPSLRKVTAKCLSQFGYILLEAEDARQAIEIWEKHRESIDLLFTDVVMPGGMTGLELAAQLREVKPGLKVIITSGYSAATSPEGPHAGGEIYLPKPYKAAMVARTIREYLDS